MGTPVITYGIIAVTVALSYMCFENRALFERLMHNPYTERHGGEYHRLLTSGFLHGSWLHLGVNMFVLYFFGSFAEQAIASDGELGFGPTLGPVVYLALYLVTIVVANLGTFLSRADDPGYSAIGASGAVSGATTLFAVFLPWEFIYLYGILPIPAIVAAVAFVAYSQYASRLNSDGIDHSAHLYGALAMPLFYMALRPNLVTHFLSALTQNFPL